MTTKKSVASMKQYLELLCAIALFNGQPYKTSCKSKETDSLRIVILKLLKITLLSKSTFFKVQFVALENVTY